MASKVCTQKYRDVWVGAFKQIIKLHSRLRWHIYIPHKHEQLVSVNKSVEFGEKLASVWSELSGTAYKRHKLCILVGHHSHTNRPCPLCIMHVFSAHAHNCMGVLVKVVDIICPS